MSENENSESAESAQKDDEEDRPAIKVTDRRLFDEEGNLREEVAEERSEESPAAEATGPELVTDESPAADEASLETPGTSPGGAPESASGGPASAPGEAGGAGRGGAGAAGSGREREAPSAPSSMGDSPPGASRAGRVGSPSAEELPRDFSSFIESQYFEALLYMGAVRHPQTGEVVEEMDLAKYKIDVLGMLKDKTEGNLEDEERQKLEDILYQLRMLYLQKREDADL